MSNVTHLLPTLTVNRQFIDDFLAARTPSFALGMIEERNKKLGLLTLRPNAIIPPEIMRQGFNFGHSLLGNADAEVVHFLRVLRFWYLQRPAQSQQPAGTDSTGRHDR